MAKDVGPISMSDLAAKGRALESSVRAIETVILHASPSLAKKTFCISSNRVVTVDGVRHEIDVHVEVAIAPGYDAVFLFECKNWEAKVGKNEIIVFSEKISALRAQKGFFVAKSFTADALAQAKKDARMELLVAAEIDSVPLPFDFFCVSPQIVTTEVSFARTAGSDDGGNSRVAIDIESAISLSEFASVRAYAAAWAADVVNGDVSLFKAHEVPDGEYSREVVATRNYDDSPLDVGGTTCTRARIKVAYRIRVVRPAVVTDYQVETRGRAISFAPVRLGPADVQVSLIALSGGPG